MASTPSSGPFFKGMEENQQNQKMQQHFSTSSSHLTAPPPTLAPQKRKRNQPGTPNADAEIIALTPRTLMAANRFICEVCNKGFQREQNLQLHRRGHNLPWKLKQNTNKEVRKKVYLCPEPTCVHHDPSRALGDLTGIKKHYFRKHGEKKYKCDKCSKKYAVQSDWKAHSKACGSKEYRCDCGTIFSRRDSFVTHRAFCEALTQESGRHPINSNGLGVHNLYGNTQVSTLGQSHVGSQVSPLQDQNPSSRAHVLRMGSHGVANPTLPNIASPSYLLGDTNQKPFPNKSLHGLMQLPDLQGGDNGSHSSMAANLINLGFFGAQDNGITSNAIEGNNNMATSGFLSPHDHLFNNSEHDTEQQGITLFSNNMGDEVGSAEGISSLLGTSIQRNISPHMSATALLQKTAQMGSTTSNTNNSTLVRNLGSSSSSDGKSKNQMLSTNFGTNVGSHETQFQGLMMGPSGISFGGFNNGGFSLDNHNGSPKFGGIDDSKLYQGLDGDENKLTLDFLGVGGMVRNFGGGFPTGDQL